MLKLKDVITELKVITTLLLFPLVCNAQQTNNIDFTDTTSFPDGKLGQVVEELIDVFNANNADRIGQFVSKHDSKEILKKFSLEDFQGYLLDNVRKTGGVNFHSTRTYTPSLSDKTVIIVKGNNFDFWYAFSLSFTNKTDYVLDRLWFSSVDAPSDILEPTISETELIEKTSALLGRLSKNDFFSGAVLVAKKDKVLFEKAYGEASKRFHAANTLNTKFNLGSMNKMFTAIAIMQLVEKNKIALDDVVSNYIDQDWLPKEITDKITVHHLLSHTSGLGSYFNKTYRNSSRELFRSLDDFKPLVKDNTLVFPPGEKYKYSNTGMLLLGVIIEKSTGQDYFEYIRENIYKPAKMINSDAFEMDQPVENLAIGYIPSSKNPLGWENNIYKHVIKGGPAGGGFSTVKDLHLFALALKNEKLVSKSSLELLWTDHAKAGYGYGFTLKSGNTGKVVGHGGGFPGLNSQLDIFLDNGYIVTVMSNYDRGAGPVAKKIYDWIENLQN
ncbi:serine hydrolase domain-containing protein [Aquimarina spongiae]|uniref:CubicO group peptidase, beta-lactamase class C family n=1 Tax=Aquimarina spongiae TaxID=570521 RepID=A0A1M6FFV4_9FLAO|nr:serine hydrolase domain-containing protein [Aquimarina spongiae]SHI96526.1 CubicO group peptidase, beta-lactamase class C family [Aquimarina spongiae]